ncbi:MAG: hypothetical protein IJ862_05505 [Selenomonadaceae bacterium]|nr:hypothetical protein [Selenomonadaceae bacterium]
MRNGSPLWLLIPHSALNGKLMAEEKNETKAASSIGKGKALAGILAVLTSAGIGAYHYFQPEETPPAPSKTEVVKEIEPAEGIGFIDVEIVNDTLDKEGHLAELIKLETRLKLELKNALQPVLMSPPKVEQKPFDDSVWLKNAQTVISEAAEIEKRRKKIAEEYMKSSEAEYFRKRDDVNNQFLNEILNIKLKLQNADSMRLTTAEKTELNNRLEEIQGQRNLVQKELKEEWVKEIADYANQAVKADEEKLKAKYQETKEKITEEARKTQEAAIERNKTLMEQAMQESKTRQDRRQKLLTELHDVTKERTELEGKMLDDISDLAAKLAVIHRLKLVLAVKDVRLNIDTPSLAVQSTTFSTDSVGFAATNEPLIVTAANSVDLTDELIKELQEQ